MRFVFKQNAESLQITGSNFTEKRQHQVLQDVSKKSKDGENQIRSGWKTRREEVLTV